MKIVYIAHPVKGFVKQNLKSVIKIVSNISKTYPDIMPIAPYVLYNYALNDRIKSDRTLGMYFNTQYFKRNFIDEVWLYGWKISKGMWKEIDLAVSLNIPIIPKTPNTYLAFKKGRVMK